MGVTWVVVLLLAERDLLNFIFFQNKENPAEETAKGFQKKDSFDGSRKDINTAIDRMCEFTGKTYVLCSTFSGFKQYNFEECVNLRVREFFFKFWGFIANNS